MRRLFLLRHAQASLVEEGLTDFDRPLSPDGRRMAEALAARLVADGIVPDHILCSSARRTRETLAILLPHLPGEPKIRLTRRLYDDAGGDYCSLIGMLGEGMCLMVVGHNPAIAATLARLGGKGRSAQGDQGAQLRRLAEKFPPAGLATIEFDADNWADIAPQGGLLVAFLDSRSPLDRADEAEQ